MEFQKLSAAFTDYLFRRHSLLFILFQRSQAFIQDFLGVFVKFAGALRDGCHVFILTADCYRRRVLLRPGPQPQPRQS